MRIEFCCVSQLDFPRPMRHAVPHREYVAETLDLKVVVDADEPAPVQRGRERPATKPFGVWAKTHAAVHDISIKTLATAQCAASRIDLEIRKFSIDWNAQLQTAPALLQPALCVRAGLWPEGGTHVRRHVGQGDLFLRVTR